MHNYSNMQSKQMEIITCKLLPFFKTLWTHAWKMTAFSSFHEFAPPIGYEHGTHFGRECVRVCVKSLTFDANHWTFSPAKLETGA